MSNINTSITNAEVIPRIESDAFVGHEDMAFAMGILAIGDQVVDGREEEFRGYLRLRANVYADQTAMISKELVRPDGTEMDEDDSRSVHFGVIENTPEGQRLVGAMRIIAKTAEDDRPLPIESFFNDEFAGNPLPVGALEASRYICRHEDARTQNKLKWPMFTGILNYMMTHELGPMYGVVEEKVERALQVSGVPITRIADPKYVPEYAADNLGIYVDTRALSARMGITPESAAEQRAHELEYTYDNLGRPAVTTAVKPAPAPLVHPGEIITAA